MKVILAVPVYKRPHIFKIFLDSFLENKKAMRGIIDLRLALAGSYAEDREIFNYYQAHIKQEEILWLDTEENTLSTKWNLFLPALKEHGPEFVVISGSDDIYSNSYWLKMYQLSKAYDHIGLLDFFLLDSGTMRMKHWNGFTRDKIGHPIGAGRWVARHILDTVDWKLCEDGLTKGVDLSMHTNISKLAQAPKMIWCKDEAIAMMDIKSETNIWAYDYWHGSAIDGSHVLPAHFSRDIIRKLVSLKTK